MGEVLAERYLHLPLHGVQLQPGSGGGQPRQPAAGISGRAAHTLRVWPIEGALEAPLRLLWQREDRGERYRSRFELHQTPQGVRLAIRCEGRGAFDYTPQGMGIHWHRQGTGASHYLQTVGLALWLEREGIPCIHANVLAGRDGAIAIMAPSRGGKTTLTAALLDAGWRLMSDDMMALHRDNGWKVYPSWPRFRMWPDMVRALAGMEPAELERVHQRFEKRIVELHRHPRWQACDRVQPLRALYLLQRRPERGGGIELERVPPSQALVMLLQNSILGDAYRALGLEAQRLNTLARLVDQVPLLRLSYPSGVERLPEVAKTL